MGEKSSWISAIKRVFSPHSKLKLTNGSSEKRIPKEKKKKKGIGRFRHGESAFRPLFREPSSIEKILDEAEREHNLIFRPPSTSDRPKSTYVSSKSSPVKVPSPPRRPDSPATSPSGLVSAEIGASSSVPAQTRPPPSLQSQHDSATRIQACFRGYLARRSFKALKGLIRLQRIVKGQSVMRQTSSAMRNMQLMVRVQTQIQSRRIDLNSRQESHIKDSESSFGKWSHASDAGNLDWNDSQLTRDQIEARLRRKADGVAKRERATAYAYSNQTQKGTKANRLPMWLNWIERQIPLPPESDATKKMLAGFDFVLDTPTPRSSRSAATFTAGRYSKTTGKLKSRGRGTEFLRDDDSLMSCPPFNVPNYMSPTASTRAKARTNSNPRERFPGTPTSDKRRLSFPPVQGTGDSSPIPKHQSQNSIGNLSAESNSRKPFNRFV